MNKRYSDILTIIRKIQRDTIQGITKGDIR